MKQREKADKRFKRLCNFSRFIRKHINQKLGEIMIDFFTNKWDESFNN